jgi:hypothetical protein
MFIVVFSFSNDSKDIQEKNKQECAQPDEYIKGVQISISLSRNMLTDPYFVNGEYFYKIRMVLRYLEPLLALGIIISFFLSWIIMDSMPMSAYELVKLDSFTSKFSLLILIPFSAFFLMFLSKYHKFKFVVSMVVGLLPFLLILFLMDDVKFEKLELQDFFHGLYICIFFSVLLIVSPLYKIFKKTSLLNKKKIAFNSKLLKPWLAFGLVGLFFLPWLNLNFSYLSGYDLLLDESYRETYWFFVIIPLFSSMLVVYYRFNMKLKVMSFLTGSTPYVILVTIFIVSDINLLVILSLGAYISLLLGAGLIFLSLRYSIKNSFNKNKNKQ